MNHRDHNAHAAMIETARADGAGNAAAAVTRAALNDARAVLAARRNARRMAPAFLAAFLAPVAALILGGAK